jgi:hypothetical protein
MRFNYTAQQYITRALSVYLNPSTLLQARPLMTRLQLYGTIDMPRMTWVAAHGWSVRHHPLLWFLENQLPAVDTEANATRALQVSRCCYHQFIVQIHTYPITHFRVFSCVACCSTPGTVCLPACWPAGHLGAIILQHIHLLCPASSRPCPILILLCSACVVCLPAGGPLRCPPTVHLPATGLQPRTPASSQLLPGPPPLKPCTPGSAVVPSTHQHTPVAAAVCCACCRQRGGGGAAASLHTRHAGG